MRIPYSYAWLLAAALLLSACNVSVSPNPPSVGDQVDVEVDALTTTGGADLTGEPAVAGSVTLAPGEDRVYEVDLPESGQPALFVYTSMPVDLYLYSGNEQLYATSSSSEYFSQGSSGLAPSAASAALAPQIVVSQECPGSCIVADNPGDGRAFVRVRNDGDATVTFTLWVVLRDFADDNEDLADGDFASFDGDSEGALETLGDEDFFVVDAGGQLVLDANETSGIQFVAEVTDPFGENPTRRVRPGDAPVQVELGEEVRVYAENDTARAAVSGTSTYFLYYD